MHWNESEIKWNSNVKVSWFFLWVCTEIIGPNCGKYQIASAGNQYDNRNYLMPWSASHLCPHWRLLSEIMHHHLWQVSLQGKNCMPRFGGIFYKRAVNTWGGGELYSEWWIRATITTTRPNDSVPALSISQREVKLHSLNPNQVWPALLSSSILTTKKDSLVIYINQIDAITREEQILEEVWPDS